MRRSKKTPATEHEVKNQARGTDQVNCPNASMYLLDTMILKKPEGIENVIAHGNDGSSNQEQSDHSHRPCQSTYNASP